MKKRKTLILLSVVTMGIAATVLTVATSRRELQFAARSETVEVDFDTANITRRIWFVNADNWWTSDTLYVHVWNDGGLDVWSGAASKIYDSYFHGLYYADVTGEGIGGAINVQVKNGSGDNPSYWTSNVAVPSLADKSSDVLFLNSGYDGSGNRNASKGTAPGTSGFVAVVLEHCLSCDSSFAYGYNSYPQLKADFIDPCEESGYFDGTMVNDYDYTEYKENGYSYSDLERKAAYCNVNEKIAQLELMYTTRGWTVAA